MQARTSCQTCGTLLVLTHEDGHWSLRCLKGHGFVNLTPGENNLPEAYAYNCLQRFNAPEDFGLLPAVGLNYQNAAELTDAYDATSVATACVSAS